MTEPLHIAVGVLVDAEKRLLIARRRANAPGAGYWEFPGGKQEAGERIFDCLSRELAEEIGVTDLRGEPLIRFSHNRGPRPVCLHVWRIHDWTGMPGGREGQLVRWVSVDEMDAVELLPATDVILAALVLPRRYWITPQRHEYGDRAWLDALDRALAAKIQLLWLHQPMLSDADYQRLAALVIERAQPYQAAVLLDRDPELVVSLSAAGLHWSTAQIRPTARRPVSAQYWFGVSARDATQLQAATDAGADFATLAPVAAIDSRSKARPLGWPGFETMRSDAALPVFALGGLTWGDVGDAVAHNAQGVAATHELPRDIRA